MRNPYSGRLCTGFRFRFRVPALRLGTLYLPLEMKNLPQIQALLNGECPLEVFGVPDIFHVWSCIDTLRMKYDFDFWAINNYRVRDIDDPDRLVPLVLNPRQHLAIDTMRKRYFLRQEGRYIISKSGPRCGLTTCIQAFILWLQTCVRSNNSYICTPNELNALQMRDNLFRFLNYRLPSSYKRIFIESACCSSFFNTFRNPDGMRGIDFGYVHLADMSKWKDPDSRITNRAYVAGISGVLLDYFAIIVLEGNVPRPPFFTLKDEINIRPRPNEQLRKKRLTSICRNPFFLNSVIVANDYPDPYLHHIDLDVAN